MSSNSLSGLRILLTNDDSIHSEGIRVLERIALSISPDVWVVAPEVGQSGKGFSVTFDDILRVKQWSPRRFSVSGTPADCVFMSLGEILKDHKPDLILSGINHGANVGDFISLSGTLGAAFAAASQGIRAIAISQHFTEPNPVKFSAVEHYFPKIAKRLLSFDWPENVCMNVNFPEAAIGDIAGIRIASQAHLSIDWKVYKKNDPVNHPYYWIQADYQDKQKFPNSDVQLIEHSNIITITAMQSRQEYTECWEKLEELFSSNV